MSVSNASKAFLSTLLVLSRFISPLCDASRQRDSPGLCKLSLVEAPVYFR